MAYKFESAHDWLSKTITEKQSQGQIDWLAEALRSLMLGLDGDAIQDAFQSEMDDDGYFTPESRPCRDCHGEGFVTGDGHSDDTETCQSCGGVGTVPGDTEG